MRTEGSKSIPKNSFTAQSTFITPTLHGNNRSRVDAKLSHPVRSKAQLQRPRTAPKKTRALAVKPFPPHTKAELQPPHQRQTLQKSKVS